jgi:hypothetical protein
MNHRHDAAPPNRFGEDRSSVDDDMLIGGAEHESADGLRGIFVTDPNV